MRGHESTVWSLDFDSSGTYIASCSEDKTWIVWSVTESGYKKLSQVRGTHFRAIYSISWQKLKSSETNAEMKHKIATVGSDNQIYVHELTQGELE